MTPPLLYRLARLHLGVEPDTSLLNERIAELERKLKREINITVYFWEEYKTKKKVKSGFLMDLLKNPKIMLIGKESDL